MKEKIEEHFLDLLILKYLLHGVMHTEESNFSNFVIEYLCEIGNQI